MLRGRGTSRWQRCVCGGLRARARALAWAACVPAGAAGHTRHWSQYHTGAALRQMSCVLTATGPHAFNAHVVWPWAWLVQVRAIRDARRAALFDVDMQLRLKAGQAECESRGVAALLSGGHPAYAALMARRAAAQAAAAAGVPASSSAAAAVAAAAAGSAGGAGEGEGAGSPHGHNSHGSHGAHGHHAHTHVTLRAPSPGAASTGGGAGLAGSAGGVAGGAAGAAGEDVEEDALLLHRSVVEGTNAVVRHKVCCSTFCHCTALYFPVLYCMTIQVWWVPQQFLPHLELKPPANGHNPTYQPPPNQPATNQPTNHRRAPATWRCSQPSRTSRRASTSWSGSTGGAHSLVSHARLGRLVSLLHVVTVRTCVDLGARFQEGPGPQPGLQHFAH